MLLKLKDESIKPFRARMDELSPWMHHYKIDDETYTGIYPVDGLYQKYTYCNSTSDKKVINKFSNAYENMDFSAKRRFFSEIIKSISLDTKKSSALDISSATGKHSLWLVEEGFSKVYSSEIRKHQVEQQQLILDSLEDQSYKNKIHVNHDEIYADQKEYQELYKDKDVELVLSFGLLYHVANPIQHIINCRAISNKYVVIYTRTRISPYEVDAWTLKQEDPNFL